MNNETILIVGVLIVAACSILYYMNSQNNILTQRLQLQEDMISSMRSRFETMESIFMRPPEAEVESIFEKRFKEPYKGNRNECVGDMCTFTPFKRENDVKGVPDEDLDDIAEKELASMMEDKTTRSPD